MTKLTSAPLTTTTPTVDDSSLDRGPQDARALLGMHTVGARFVLAAYLACMAYVNFTSLEGVSTVWPSVIALVALTAAAVALISAPGDPLPVRWALLIAAACPVTAVLTLSVSPAPLAVSTQGWAHGATTVLLCFLCVRGRTTFAWLGLAGSVAVHTIWASLVGLGATTGLGMVLIDFGPVAIGAVFSLTIRPAAKAIFELRAAGAQQAAVLAARTAAAAERDTQLAELDRLARPMLDRIASGAELTAAERSTCELLEAHLRDRLRAPGLVSPAIADAARSARARGVEVILLDDRTAEPLTPDARERIHTEVVDTLVRARSGDVRVRLLPPHRAAAASIYVRSGHDTGRREFDATGADVDR
ncbi:hypothetical protein [Williamsia maris]|uniref:Uncharacterized protein n=1 Tax=Williamsia maris TaxID=72806 RepID=A0ABT1HIT9_9NOCA|nr:hypothetical protein [Williamsia maris]MCP2177855.1 hypothetical protein [Williamsia maris]